MELPGGQWVKVVSLQQLKQEKPMATATIKDASSSAPVEEPAVETAAPEATPEVAPAEAEAPVEEAPAEAEEAPAEEQVDPAAHVAKEDRPWFKKAFGLL
jgi:hypothetical protein